MSILGAVLVSAGLLLHALDGPDRIPVLTRHCPSLVLLDNAGGWTSVGGSYVGAGMAP
mgnify:CR=1 FL=1